MTFSESISSVYRNYFRFGGRASRSEYWFFHLLVILYFVVMGIVATLLLQTNETAAFSLALLNAIVVLGSLIPLFAVQVRRLHDIGVSGFWYGLLFVIIMFGQVLFSAYSDSDFLPSWYLPVNIFMASCSLIFLIACMKKGTHGFNKFGDDPLYEFSGNDNQSALSSLASKSKSSQRKIHSSSLEKETGFENKVVTKEASRKRTENPISDSISTSKETNRLNGKEYDYFEKAFDEIERDQKHKGIWAKAYSVALDDESAKRLYIKYRTEYLIEEATLSARKPAVQLARFSEEFGSKGLKLVSINDGWEVMDFEGSVMSTRVIPTLSEVDKWIDAYDPHLMDSYNERGYTRLMESTVAGDFKEVRLLLALGANPKIKDRDTKASNAFSIAARKKGDSAIHLDIFNLLWKRG